MSWQRVNWFNHSNVWLSLMFIILPQLQLRSVLIAQQQVSIFKGIIWTETFHSNKIVHIGELLFACTFNCVEIFRKEGQQHKCPRKRYKFKLYRQYYIFWYEKGVNVDRKKEEFSINKSTGNMLNGCRLVFIYKISKWHHHKKPFNCVPDWCKLLNRIKCETLCTKD